MSDLWWPKFIRKPRITLPVPQIREIHMPSKWIFFAIAIGIYYFIVSGSIHTLTYTPIALGSTSSGPLLIYPALHHQFLIEGIVGGVFYFLGFLGFYFTYQSTRHIYRPRYAQMMLAMGWALIFISFFGCQWLVNLKLAG